MPEVTASGQVIYGANNTNTTMYGETPEYLDIKQWNIAQGDVFTDEDIRKNAKVCIVGKTIVDNLFGDGVDPIDKVIRFKSIPFRIVGVLESKGYNNWGMDQDNVIIAPYTTVMKRLLAQNYLQSINASALTEEVSDEAIDDEPLALRQIERFVARLPELELVGSYYSVYDAREVITSQNIDVVFLDIEMPD